MNQSPLELLGAYARIMGELRSRGVLRSSNNPVADYAEFLVCKALSLELAPKSAKGHDAIGPDGTRFEIKARRPLQKSGARQLSALRKLDEQHFDFLVGVLFNEDFTVAQACIVPHEIVKREARFVKHTNAWCFHLVDHVWDDEHVRDITEALQGAQAPSL